MKIYDDKYLMRSIFKIHFKLLLLTFVLAVTGCSDYEFEEEQLSSVGGDNLGDHTVQRDLDLNGQKIVGEDGAEEGLFISPLQVMAVRH